LSAITGDVNHQIGENNDEKGDSTNIKYSIDANNVDERCEK
jgi:hypothetical protein